MLSLLLAGAAGDGCSPLRRGEPPEPPHAPITLEVRNNNWSDITIYAIRSGQRMRLGTVIATQSTNMVVPPDMLGPGGEVRVYAQAIGGYARYTSPKVYASPGATVTLNLEIDLRRSTLTTW